MKPVRRFLHVVHTERLGSGKRGGLLRVRGDNASQGYEFLEQGLFALIIEQACSGSGVEDRIEHDVRELRPFQKLSNFLRNLARSQHADANSGNLDVGGQIFEAVEHELGRDRLDLAHARRGLHSQRRNHGHAITAVSSDGLNVGSHPRARRWVETRKRQHDRRTLEHRANLSKTLSLANYLLVAVEGLTVRWC